MVSPHSHRTTLTHIEGNCGGLQFCSTKTLSTIEVKCGGGWLRELETLTHDGVWYGSVAPPPLVGHNATNQHKITLHRHHTSYTMQ